MLGQIAWKYCKENNWFGFAYTLSSSSTSPDTLLNQNYAINIVDKRGCGLMNKKSVSQPRIVGSNPIRITTMIPHMTLVLVGFETDLNKL